MLGINHSASPTIGLHPHQQRALLLMSGDISTTGSSSSHGLKRKNEDDLASEQRLAKRFHLLNLGKQKHQITAEDIQQIQQQLAAKDEELELTNAPAASGPRLQRSRSNAFSDSMHVDESRDRIFIHNLEDELADLSSDEEHPIFIPDIEKRLNVLPKALLRSEHPHRSSNELILYEVPSSLSIPVGQDSTRKAILESRHRAQQEALNSAAGSAPPAVLNAMPPVNLPYGNEDAMDIS